MSALQPPQIIGTIVAGGGVSGDVLYVDSSINLAQVGGTTSQVLQGGTPPTFTGSPVVTTQSPNDNSTKVATTAYVDEAVTAQDYKEAVKYASIAALPSIVYANGSSGVGATLTGVALAAISLDSSSPAVNDRVLIKNQASDFQNGIYKVTATGSGIAVFVLTRATDFDQSNEINTGDAVFVTAGSTLSATTWAYTGIDSPTMGTTSITFVQIAGQGSFTGGTGITITGTSIALTTPVVLANGGTSAALTADNGGIFYSTATAGAILASTATASKMLLSGASTTPTWSTSTIPTSAGATALKHLKSDGTNYVLTTATISDSPSTAGKVLVSDGTNWITSTPTFPNASATSLKHIRSDGTNWIASTVTYPDAAVTAGKVMVSDGTNYIASTPTFPNASATSGKFIRSDGTNWIASTPTLPTSAGSAGKILASDGTNYVESTPTFPYSASATSGKLIISDGTNWIASTTIWPNALTTGSVPYTSATNTVGQDNANFFWDGTNHRLGIGLTNPGSQLTVQSSSTSGANFLITNTGISTSGSVATITANSLTTGDVLTLNATGMTTGSLIIGTGPTSTGVTDNFVSLTSAVGSGVGLVKLVPDFTGSAVTGYGQWIAATDSTANANSDYAGYNSLTLTGNAAKNGYGVYSIVNSSSTTADSVYAGYFTTVASGNTNRANHFGVYSFPQSTSTTADKVYGIYSAPTKTGNVGSGTQSSYGIYLAPSSTGPSTSTTATTNVYGAYVGLTATHAADAGTVNGYGLYVANGTFSTNGTSKNIGLYVESPTGADTNYTAIFADGSVGIGTTTPQNTVGAGTGVLEISSSSARGVLGLTNTSTSTSGTAGSIVFNNGSTRLGQIDVGADGATNSGLFSFYTNNAGSLGERMRIDHTGKVGIGTTTPALTLDVSNGSSSAYDTMQLSNTASGGYRRSGLLMQHGANASAAIQLLLIYSQDDNSTNNMIIGGGNGSYNAATNIQFNTAANGNTTIGTSRMTINSSGAVNVVGALSKGSGSFLIPHPDPKKTKDWDLRHSFVETPTRGDNIYRYHVTVEKADTEVITDLPDYYQYLNENSDVWINSINGYGMGYGWVAKDDKSFTIKCNQAGDYLVMIMATRKDKVAKDGFDKWGVEYEFQDGRPSQENA